MNTIRAHCIGWSLAGAIVLAGVGSQSLRPTEALRGPALALVGATVIDGTGGPPIPDVVVVVEGGRIVGVGPRARMNVPPGPLQRDVAGLTILPGLIDSHVHLILLVAVGLSPMEAIQAATIRPARILGRKDLGTVEPGMRADLIVVAGNPLRSISETRNIQVVLRDGKVFDYSGDRKASK